VPKLIVYVKSSTWQRVVDQAGEDAPALARALSVKAIEEFVAGLSERGKAMVSEEISEQASAVVEHPKQPPRSESRHVTEDQEWLMRRAGKRK